MTLQSRGVFSIKSAEYSIDVGTHYLANLLKKASCESPLDMEHIRLALQSYNYGSGYLDWAVNRDGGYTVENAVVFSDEQAAKTDGAVMVTNPTSAMYLGIILTAAIT